MKNTPPDEKIGRYFEPFLGAASVFLANGFKNATLSDANQNLINAFLAVKKDPKKLHKLLLVHRKKLNKTYYKKIRTEYNEERNTKTLEQAARFIFLIHTSFNGIYRVNQKGEYNVPVGKLKPSLPTLEHLEMISKKLRGVTIKAMSYENILPLVSKDDFIYLDPPYPPLNATSSFQHYTTEKFSREEQERVAKFANDLKRKGCLVLISNADVRYVRKLYRGWKINTLNTVRFVSCKKKRNTVKELIIRNY